VSAPPLDHILIVDDDEDLLEVLKYVLGDAGYRVSMAGGRRGGSVDRRR
jgi:DNA-binding response OmpR family regulator